MKIEKILLAEYSGDPVKDMKKILQAHHFIMDDRNSITERAMVYRDVARRALNHDVSMEIADIELVGTYIKEMCDVFLRQ